MRNVDKIDTLDSEKDLDFDEEEFDFDEGGVLDIDDEEKLGYGEGGVLDIDDEEKLGYDEEEDFALDGEEDLGFDDEELDIDDGGDISLDDEEDLDTKISKPSKPRPKMQQKQETNEEFEKALSRIGTLEDSLAKINATVSMVSQSNDDAVEKLKKLEETSLQFLSLYELVTDQINPFVTDSTKNPEFLDHFEKIENRINQLEEYGSSIKRLESVINSDFDLEQIELKFNNIYQTMTELREKQAETEEKQKMIDESKQEMIMEEIEEIKKSLEEKLLESEVKVLEESNNQSANQVQSTHTPMSLESEGVRLVQVGNDPIKVLALIRWIEFLMNKVGRNNFLETLNYYVQIKWISKDVRNQMIEYARGIEHYEDKPEWRLSPEDHKKSLLFIETIRGTDINMTTINLTEQEISKLKNVVEGQYGI